MAAGGAELDAGGAGAARPGIAHRLSWLRGQRGGDDGGVVVVGRRGMRPVSVEGGLGRGRPGSASLRGDLAFV